MFFSYSRPPWSWSWSVRFSAPTSEPPTCFLRASFFHPSKIRRSLTEDEDEYEDEDDWDADADTDTDTDT